MEPMPEQKYTHMPGLDFSESRISGSHLMVMLLLILTLTFFCGCASGQKNLKLEEVARNWSWGRATVTY